MATETRSRVRGLSTTSGKTGPHVALISERDTFGRTLPKFMARCLKREECEPPSADPLAGKDELLSCKYLRGLDGQMTNAQDASPIGSAKDTNSKQEENKGSIKGSRHRPQDRAEGQGQLDYLRRLADRI